MPQITTRTIPPLEPQPQRIGAVLRPNRFIFPIRDGSVHTTDTAGFSDYSDAETVKLKTLAAKLSSSVGKVMVKHDSSNPPTAIGTCFCVSSSLTNGVRKFRCLTNNHLLWLILPRGARLYKYFQPRVLGGIHLPTLAEFQLNGVNVSFEMTKIIWSHQKWDLMILEFEAPDHSPVPAPLKIANSLPEADWNVDQNKLANCRKTFVIGYPLKSIPGSDVALVGALGELSVSPGFTKPYMPVSQSIPPEARYYDYVFEHEASTCPGHSGSPLIDLEIEEVIGLHYRGGRLETNVALTDMPIDTNHAFNLLEIMKEDSLRREVLLEATPASTLPIRNDWSEERQPTYFGAGDTNSDLETLLKNDIHAPTPLKTVVADRSDFRDLIYKPRLLQPPDIFMNDAAKDARVHDQGRSTGCVAFALATLIEMQLANLAREENKVSPHMLYANAKKFDEWLNDQKGGTSLRAALKGFYTYGVCSEILAPSQLFDTNRYHLTREMSRNARQTQLGSYMRVKPNLRDYQTAIFEGGAMIVSAKIHKGWVQRKQKIKTIPFRKTKIGAHAFVISGYNSKGFIIQNSWGEDWGDYEGQPGTALWTYEDWAESVIDAWVLRLAPSLSESASTLLHVSERNDKDNEHTVFPNLPKARMSEVIGHIHPLEAEWVVNNGKYGIGLATMYETLSYLSTSKRGQQRYKSIALVFTEPFWTLDDACKLVRRLTPEFKSRQIYPLFFHDGGAEMRILRAVLREEIQSATAPFEDTPHDLTPYILEHAPTLVSDLFSQFAIRREISANTGALAQTLSIYLDALRTRGIAIVSYGAGAVSALHAKNWLDNQTNANIYQQFHCAPIDSPSLTQTKTSPICLALLRDAAATKMCPILKPFQGDFIDIIKASSGQNWSDDFLEGEATLHSQLKLLKTDHEQLAGLATDESIIAKMMRLL